MSPTTELAPVRDGLLRRARADAERVIAASREESARVVAEARAEADRIIAVARQRGLTDANVVRAAALSRSRRTARGTGLAARQSVYDELCRLTREELGRRFGDPDLRDVLVARIRQALGPTARIADDPGGGVIGVLDGRRVDFTVDTMAARAVEALGTQVEDLWAG